MSGAYTTGSGSMKVDTSEAAEPARDKITDEVMIDSLRVLSAAGARGATAKEIAPQIGREKGRVSTALTNMNIMDRVVKLDERRNRHYVYVLPSKLGDRAYIPYVPQKVHLRGEDAIVLAERLAVFLEDRTQFNSPPSPNPQPGDRELARLLRYVVGVSRGKKPTTRQK